MCLLINDLCFKIFDYFIFPKLFTIFKINHVITKVVFYWFAFGYPFEEKVTTCLNFRNYTWQTKQPSLTAVNKWGIHSCFTITKTTSNNKFVYLIKSFKKMNSYSKGFNGFSNVAERRHKFVDYLFVSFKTHILCKAKITYITFVVYWLIL